MNVYERESKRDKMQERRRGEKMTNTRRDRTKKTFDFSQLPHIEARDSGEELGEEK